MNNIIVHYEVSRFFFTLRKIPANVHVVFLEIIYSQTHLCHIGVFNG
jgi:hypothetical protein